MPVEMRSLVEGMLRPETIAIVTGTLIAWVGAHLFGVGEIVDIILVGIGVVSLGFAVFEGAAELLKFASTALNATSSADLDAAGQHMARAVTLLGVSTVQALLLRGKAVL